MERVVRFALPSVGEQIVVTIGQMLNLMLVGHLGVIAVAAAGLAISPTFFLFGFLSAVAIGATALVARFTGANETTARLYAGTQSLLLGLLVGVALAAACFTLSRPFLAALGGKDAVLQAAVTYFQIMVWSVPVQGVAFVANGILRGYGDTRSPFWTSSLAALLQVPLSLWWMYGGLGVTPWGIRGAAWGLLISRTVGCSASLALLFRSRGPLNHRLISKTFFWPRRLWITRIAHLGLPAAAEQLILRTGSLLFTRLVASLGATAFATHQLALNVESLAYMPAFGFEMAATALVGQYVGAHRPNEAQRATLLSALSATAVQAAMGFYLWFGGGAMLHLYTSDPQVIRLGATILRIMAIADLTFPLALVFSGALRGAGDTRSPLYITAFVVWGVRLPLGWWFALGLDWHLQGIWYALAIDQSVQALLAYLRFRQGKWRDLRI